MEIYLYQGLIGLTYSMYLWLLAAGLSIAFGVLGILNFSHGALFMLGPIWPSPSMASWGSTSGWRCC